MAAQKSFVIIIGAGPSGLLLSLLLSRSSIPTLLLEASTSLDTNPRATHYGAPAMAILRRAGVVPDMLSQGFVPDVVCWRKLSGERIAGLSFGSSARHGGGGKGDERERVTCLPLSKLGGVLLEHLKGFEGRGLVKVRWGCKVLEVGEDGEGAWVHVEGGERLRAEYVVGCDGANSVVRRSLFGKGDEGFPGMTWGEQIVATNTYYDFTPYGWDDSNFIIDPVHWYMAARISTDGMWRITYGELPGLTNEQLKERQPMKFEQMLPGQPKPDQYKIVNFSPYRVHQRLAPRMRVGRILLAADAAHLCNPFGGMGLTSGIVDVGGLHDCLAGIHTGQVDADFILEKYHEIRSQKFHDIINPISTANIKRLFGQDPELAGEKDEFLKMCKVAEEGDERVKEMFTMGALALGHDFTQYYKKEGKGWKEGDVMVGRKVGEVVMATPVAVTD